MGSTTALGSTAAGTVVNNGAALDLNGQTYANLESLTINGTGVSGGGAIFNSSGSAATFPGTITLASASTITTDNQITLSGTISNNQHFTKNGSNSLIFANNTVTVNNFALSAGTLDCENSTINIYGDFTSNGTFNPNTSNVIMLGAGVQTIPAVSFNNLNINNPSGTILGGNILVDGTLTLTDGILNTGSYLIDLGSNGTLVETPINPTSYVLGTIKATRPLMQNIQNNFGGIGVEITEANENNNLTEVIRVTGVACTAIDGNEGITRYFTINPTIDTDLNATLIFHYFDNEIVGHTETNLLIYKSTDNRVTWSEIIPNSRDVINNTLTINNITDFSDWTASDGESSPLPIELISFSAIVSELGIEIHWSTATEINNDFFTLERSYDGITWTPILQMPGQGNSSYISEYKYIDEDFDSNTLYYKLKQTDYDGTSSFSKIITVYPHQFQNNITITYNKRQQIIEITCNNIKSIELLNIKGQVVFKTEQSIISTNNISSGVYYVYIQTQKSFISKTIIID